MVKHRKPGKGQVFKMTKKLSEKNGLATGAVISTGENVLRRGNCKTKGYTPEKGWEAT